MNQEMVEFARTKLKERLRLLGEHEQMTFRRMYSHLDLEKPLDQVVDDMPEERLDWAMTQVSNTLKHKEGK